MSSNTNNSVGSIHKGDHSVSSHSYDDSGGVPFFADMTLDLAEAHDIAETPDPSQKSVIGVERMTPSASEVDFPTLPVLRETRPNNNVSPTTTTTLPDHPQPEEESSPQHCDFNPQDGMDSNDLENRDMGRLTNDPRNMRRRFQGLGNRLKSNRRTWPKDVSWAVAFCVVVPSSLLFPVWFARVPEDGDKMNSSRWLATATSPRLAIVHTILWGLGIAIVLSRLLYKTAGGGDGDDARHFASQILLASAPISVSVFIMLVAAMKLLTPRAFWPFAIVPLWYLARDLYLFRSWKMTATTPGGRQAFFQALTCMALDILSRSLRRNALWRVIVGVIVTQFAVIYLWRVSLLAAIGSESVVWILMAFVGGKWATGTVARLLSLIACGGISNWFAEQSTLVEEMNASQKKRFTDNPDDEEMIEFADLSNGNSRSLERRPSMDEMPEAYTSVDASAYASVLHDEGMEDDDELEDEEDGDFVNSGPSGPAGIYRYQGSSAATQQHRKRQSRSTVKQFLTAGLSVNFGSVAKCGLLGGVAQWCWSQIRKIDHARATFGRGSMQGMEIRGAGSEQHTQGMYNKVMQQINMLVRDFVRSHSDMAMTYVADYQLSYTRAAQDVALKLDEAGVEPIIHDDISTHMSSCVGGSISGLIVLFTGAVLTHQRNRNNPGIPDSAVVIDMLLSFFFCYTLIFTVMEPLRASIKAVYVCFAQHPESLSQAFPLIFHRLTRMSRSNLN
jgi:hypothetical protein